jgi:hypothetical protein
MISTSRSSAMTGELAFALALLTSQALSLGQLAVLTLDGPVMLPLVAR